VPERLMAWIALLAVAAAVVLLAVGVVRHLLMVLIAVACLAVCVSAGWYAVSRRGLLRLLAVAVMLASLAGLITATVLASLSRARLLDVLLAGVLAVGAGRLALRRTARERHAAATRVIAGTRPAHPVLIVNPKSGGGKAARAGLDAECEQRGIRPVPLRPGDDLAALAEAAVRDGADAIGMAGGDGSQAVVAGVAARHRVPFVCVPAGTRNHFALDLGLDRDEVAGALAAFSDGTERAVDLARVNGRVFVNNASLGVYAKVVQSPDYRAAKVRTAGTVLPGLLGPGAAALDLKYRGPDGRSHPTAQLILVSNGPYQLEHLGGLGTRERLDRGVLGVVAVHISDAAAATHFAALQAAGQVRRFPGWHEWSALRFEVRSAGPVEVGLDGEAVILDPPLVFESLPGALRVLVPKASLRPAPASRAVRVLTGSALSELGQLAVGRRPAPR
jgi:diacylglycerol kinase family enzyme